MPTEDLKILKDNEKRARKQDLEQFIYQNYQMAKQQQDEKWVSNYTTKLKAYGVENLEKTIVEMASKYFAGADIKECLNDIEDDTKYMYEKLLKVAIRTQWTETSIAEGSKAINEDRVPNFPVFPNFGD